MFGTEPTITIGVVNTLVVFLAAYTLAGIWTVRPKTGVAVFFFLHSVGSVVLCVLWTSAGWNNPVLYVPVFGT